MTASLAEKVARRFVVAEASWGDAQEALKAFQKAVDKVKAADVSTQRGRNVLEEYAFVPNDLMISVVSSFREWAELSLDAGALGEMEALRPNGAMFLDTTPETYEQILPKLDAYRDKVLEYVSKGGTPSRFTYKGFKINDTFGLGDQQMGIVLNAINYMLAVFKKRGVEDLLHEGLKEVILGPTDGDVGAFYSHDQTITIGPTVLDSRTHRMLTEGDWLMGTFMHEFAHFVHMSYIKGEAKAFWDQTWDPIKQVKNKLQKIESSELERFFKVLERDGFDPAKTARKLKGADKVKFAYWLRNPGFGAALITPNQFRLTKRGQEFFKALRDPGTYVWSLYGYQPGTPEHESRVKRLFEHKKEILGVGYKSGLALSPDKVEELRKADPSIEKALEKLYAEIGVPSEYGKTDEFEDFADSFVVFMANPGKLSENALYRMKRTLWLSGFGGKPVMRLAQKVVRRFVAKDLDLEALVYRYVKVKPSYRSFRILADKDWAVEVPEDASDRLTGGVAAITTPDGDILIKKGYEDSAVHELLHTAGFMPEGVNDFLSEGVTQAITQRICSGAGIPVRNTYKEEVRFVERYVLPLVGMSPQAFAQGYARASNKGRFLVDLIWTRHGDKFTDTEDWGSNPYASFARELPKTLGDVVQLTYLVDELRVGGKVAKIRGKHYKINKRQLKTLNDRTQEVAQTYSIQAAT